MAARRACEGASGPEGNGTESRPAVEGAGRDDDGAPVVGEGDGGGAVVVVMTLSRGGRGAGAGRRAVWCLK